MTTVDGRALDPAPRSGRGGVAGPSARRVPSPLLLSASVFLGAMAFRSPELLSRPRFLAEEGFVYHQYMQHSSFVDGLLFVFRGNYQLLTT